MRISDWSSDVCSSDLPDQVGVHPIQSRFGVIDNAHQHMLGVDVAPRWAEYPMRLAGTGCRMGGAGVLLFGYQPVIQIEVIGIGLPGAPCDAMAECVVRIACQQLALGANPD